MTDAKHEAPAEGMRAALLEIANRPLLDEPLSADGHRNRCPSCGHAWSIHKTPHHAPTCDRMTAIAALNEAPAKGAGEREEIARIVEPSAFVEETTDHSRVYRNLSLQEGRAEAFTKAEKIIALRVRSSAPEAREGEAVAWRRRVRETPSGVPGVWGEPFSYCPERSEVMDVQPLYTHPAAPSADKLRIAVEALDEARENLIQCGDHFGAGQCADAVSLISTPDALKGDN